MSKPLTMAAREILEAEIKRADKRKIKELRAEIERKDKLIERIYETLKNVIQSADAEWESKNLGHDWQEACQSMRAALELVEKEMR